MKESDLQSAIDLVAKLEDQPVASTRFASHRLGQWPQVFDDLLQTSLVVHVHRDEQAAVWGEREA